MDKNLPNDCSENKYLNDLLRVGPDKPLGYLPLNTIREECKVNPLDVAKYLKRRGLEIKAWKQSFCKVWSGALFVYDRESLQKLLDQHSGILIEANWPSQADDFVVQVATTLAKSPALFDLVATAFADYQN